MDDTVLLATTRETMRKKLDILLQFCDTYGMKINESKTKFFVICGNQSDRESFELGDFVVEPCEQYVYLGSPFTCDGSVSSSVKAHANTKMAHVNKFVSFLKKNNDVPLIVKKRIFDAALMSTLLYGCESWLNADLRPVVKIYNLCMKQLLGVRGTTCNEMCYVELGYPPLKELVRSKQRKFFETIWQQRSNMTDDPLIFAINVTLNERYNTKTFVSDLLFHHKDDIAVAMESLKQNIILSDSSRKITYKEINPALTRHELYTCRHGVREDHRLSFSRFRLSAHWLAVEVGRWNRRGRGRLPLAERLCPCGMVQTEHHVIHECPLSQHIRDAYGLTGITNLFSGTFDNATVCSIINSVLNLYSQNQP